MTDRVMTTEIKLTGREYKLLLDPLRFKEVYGLRGVHVFWEKGLKPIIADRIDRRRSGKPRFKGEVGRPTKRIIRFRDTDDIVLTRSEWSLRQRTRIVDDREDLTEHELTLKLRTPDLFIAAATVLARGIEMSRTRSRKILRRLASRNSARQRTSGWYSPILRRSGVVSPEHSGARFIHRSRSADWRKSTGFGTRAEQNGGLEGEEVARPVRESCR